VQWVTRARSGGAVVPGALVGAVLVAATVLLLVPLRTHISPATPALVLTVAVGASAVVGGVRAAIAVALAAALTLDLAFLPPYGRVHILTLEDTVAFGTFLLVAVTVGVLVSRESDRRREAEHREAEVRALNARLRELHDERAVLTARADRADDLARLDDQRTALLRSVSHDLRTPLSAIRAVVTDLRDGVVYDDDTRVGLLSMVCDEVDRLDRLVANLVSLSRIEAGAFNPDRQAVDLDELIADRVRRLEPLFRDVALRTDVPDDLPLVDADYAHVEQVLTNLLANAARHAPTASDVWVLARADGADVRIEVSDRGKGVDEVMVDRIFEPFQRGEGSRSSGIGLAICKAIVEAHGGAIGVERTFGGGATFVFTLPQHRGSVPA
jgi:two-component system, OmpR family, sensor histidine kinase KdpD